MVRGNKIPDSDAEVPEQEYISADTSINSSKRPAVFNIVGKEGGWKKGTINADIGGGRFETATEYLKEQGVTNVIWDPFNRPPKENAAAVEKIANGKSDTATVSNVLNVIAEPKARDMVIASAASSLKAGGAAYFSIYEGDRSGQGHATPKGYQLNRPTKDYVGEISKFFGDVTVRHGVIVATQPKEIDPHRQPVFSVHHTEKEKSTFPAHCHAAHSAKPKRQMTAGRGA